MTERDALLLDNPSDDELPDSLPIRRPSTRSASRRGGNYTADSGVSLNRMASSIHQSSTDEDMIDPGSSSTGHTSEFTMLATNIIN